jgi:hypothetical protein
MTMAYEHLKDSALPRAFLEVVADLADLVQKELRLARQELSEKLSIKVRGGVWMAAAGVAGFIAALLVIEAIVFGIAAAGIAMHWSCLIVAALLALVGALAYAKGRSDLAEELVPRRTLNSIKQDATVAKEQVT